MAELSESGSREPGADFGESIVVANADGVVGHAEPDGSAGSFDGAGQSAIVDDCVANSGNTTDGFERRGTDENTTAGGGSGPAIALIYPDRRIEHEKEKDKGWDQQ